RAFGQCRAQPQVLALRPQHRHARQQSPEETRRYGRRRAYQDHPGRRLHLCPPPRKGWGKGEGNVMKSLFLKIFLSFWVAQALFLVLALLVMLVFRPQRNATWEALRSTALTE